MSIAALPAAAGAGATAAAPRVERRALPYPYRALLAICSDLDETPDAALYVETARYLNTTGPTAFGPGCGLEVGNTIYFAMPPGQFAYWTTDDAGRAAVRALIRSGHVDCLHSFGDLAVTRADAARALDELARHGCRLEVWIDHAVAITNLGADIMRGEGDVPGAAAYHADLSVAAGIRYVWRGRVTSVTGQGVTRRLGGIFDAGHPLASTRTLMKEGAKGVLPRLGQRRYAFHATNDVVAAATLRDGQPVVEFMRANPHWGGVSCCETATGFGEVATAGFLARLVARGGTCVLYTHLGKVRDVRAPFTPEGRAGLARLAEAQHAGDVLVTTTRRLLGYTSAGHTLAWTARAEGATVTIDVHRPRGPLVPAPADLDGLTFYVDAPDRTRLLVDGVEPPRVLRHPADHTGRPGIGLPWPRLEFPL